VWDDERYLILCVRRIKISCMIWCVRWWMISRMKCETMKDISFDVWDIWTYALYLNCLTREQNDRRCKDCSSPRVTKSALSPTVVWVRHPIPVYRYTRKPGYRTNWDGILIPILTHEKADTSRHQDTSSRYIKCNFVLSVDTSSVSIHDTKWQVVCSRCWAFSQWCATLADIS